MMRLLFPVLAVTVFPLIFRITATGSETPISLGSTSISQLPKPASAAGQTDRLSFSCGGCRMAVSRVLPKLAPQRMSGGKYICQTLIHGPFPFAPGPQTGHGRRSSPAAYTNPLRHSALRRRGLFRKEAARTPVRTTPAAQAPSLWPNCRDLQVRRRC